MRNNMIFIIILFIVSILYVPTPQAYSSQNTTTNSPNPSLLHYVFAGSITPSKIQIRKIGSNTIEIRAPGFQQVMGVKRVLLPARIYRILLPPTTISYNLTCSFHQDGALIIPAGHILSPQPASIMGGHEIPAPNLTFPYPSSCARIIRESRGPGGSIFLAIAVYPIILRDQSIAVYGTAYWSLNVTYTAVTSKPHVPRYILDMADNRASALSWYSVLDRPGYIVLLGNRSLLPSVIPLIRLRAAEGYNVYVYNLSDVLSLFPNTTINGSIRSFARYAVRALNAEYLLLVGDSDLIPPAYFYAQENYTSYGENYYKATDLYYALLNGTWDPNNNGLLLESLDTDGDNYPDKIVEPLPDTLADILVGRIPADTPGQVATIVNNILAREENPPAGSWYKRMLFMSAILNYYNESDLWSGAPKTDTATTAEYIIHHVLANQSLAPGVVFNYTRLYESEGLSPSIYDHELPLNKTNAARMINEGFSFVMSSAHGNIDGQYRKVWATDDGDNIPEPDEMEWPAYVESYDPPVAGAPYIAYLDSCLAGFFDYPGFRVVAEKLLDNGAASVIASSRISYYMIGWSDPDNGTYDQELDYMFWKQVFSGYNTTLGEALYASKYDYSLVDNLSLDYAGMKDFLVYNLLGDPALKLYVDPTLKLEVSAYQSGSDVEVSVVDSEGSPVVGSLVTLMDSTGNVIAQAYTDAYGNATLELPYSISGYYYVYAYKQPYPVNFTGINLEQINNNNNNTSNNTNLPEAPTLFQVEVSAPAIAFTGSNTTVTLAFTLNGSLVDPDNLKVSVIPSGTILGVKRRTTDLGPIYTVTLSSVTPGPVSVIVSATLHGLNATGVATVTYVDPWSMESQAQNIMSELLTINNTISSMIGKMYSMYSNITGWLAEIKGDTATIILKEEVLNESLQSLNATLVDIDGGLAIINTSLGLIAANLSSIVKGVETLNDSMLTVETLLGNITSNLTMLDARLVSVANGIAVINTSIGNILVAVNQSVNSALETVESILNTINNNIYVLNTTLQNLKPTLVSINGSLATLNTSLGNIVTSLSLLRSEINGINVSVKNNTIQIMTKLGSITTRLDTINATVLRVYGDTVELGTLLGNITLETSQLFEGLQALNASVNNGLLVIETRLGSIMAGLSSINATLVELCTANSNNTTQAIAVLNTTLGRVYVKLANIEGSLNNISSLQKETLKTLRGLVGQVENLSQQSTSLSARNNKTARLASAGVALSLVSLIGLLGVVLISKTGSF